MNVTQNMVVAVAVALAAGVASADSVPAARGLISSNSINRTVNCRYYKAWYIDGCDKSELSAILQRNIEGHKRWIALSGEDTISPQSDLGKSYAALGKWKEAKAELVPVVEKLAAGAYMDATRVSEAKWEMANILWQEGDKAGAKKYLDEVAEMYGTGKVSDFLAVTGRAKYLSAVLDDPDADIDMLKLPHSVDCRPFPTPQKATYGEAKVSLARVEVSLKEEGKRKKEEGENNPIVRLLKKKLTRFGSTFEKGGTIIELEISPDAPVDKPQGYALEVRRKKEEGKSSSKEEVRSKKEEGRSSEKEEVRRKKEEGKSNKEEGRSSGGVVLIKARDRLGLTWGVVSLLQCVQRKESSGDNSTPLPSSSFLLPSICTMRIEDWPKCENRGVTPYWYPEFLEYALFYKMKNVDFTMDRQFILSPLDKEYYRIVASRFADFGLEVNIDTDSIDVRPLPPYSSPRTWKLHLAWSKFLASIGVGRDLMLDDDRFPMHPKDLEAAGTAANLDAKFVTRLYREVKKKYPNFRMKFGAPFYWGPDGSVSYPEPRDEYLKSIAADLDPEIGVFWTGPYVKSVCLNERTIGWVTNLTGRKPTIFHNGNAVGQHNYIQYGADLTGYKESHSTNVFDLVSAFFQNMSKYAEACEVGSCMDWCWNPEAHDPKVAVRRAIDLVEGPGVSEVIKEATPYLAYFDKYVYGKPRIEVLTEDQADLDGKIAAAEAAWQKVLSLAKNGGLFVKDFNRAGIKYAKRIAAARRNPPENLLKERDAVMANAVFAEKEAGFDANKGCEFFPSAILRGARFVPGLNGWGDKRKYGEGAKRDTKYISPGEEVEGSFECELFPPEKPFKLVLCGMAYIDPPPEIEVELNGQVVWRGALFERYYFKTFEVELPVVAIARKNVFKIRNVTQEETLEKRRKLVLHYAVVKKEQ